MQTYNPFWKKTMDVRNRVKTRAKLKIRQKQAENYNAVIRNGLIVLLQTTGILLLIGKQTQTQNPQIQIYH